MPTLTVPDCWPNHGDSYVYGAGPSYPPAFTGADGSAPIAAASRSLVSGSHYVYCALLRFDTSALPDDATIESATLQLYLVHPLGQVYAVWSADERKLVADFYDAGDAPDAADYTATAGTSAISGWALRTRVGKEWVQIPLTSVTGIQRSGITGLRLHISGGAPTGENYVKFATSHYWTSIKGYPTERGAYAPRLVVTYAQSSQVPPSGGGSQPTSGQTADPAGSGAQPLALRHLPREAVQWELELCDWQGVKISHITSLGRNRQLQYRLNRPAVLTFQVPSDDPRVSGLHTDGLPLLWAEPGWRTIKAYRHEIAADGTETRVLRFAGYLWSVQDAGDPHEAWTQLTAFDPLQVLSMRHTNEPGAGPVKFVDQAGSTIVRQLVDTTNATRGRTGITTDDGVFEQTPARTVTYDMRPISEVCYELASAFNGFDLWLEPLDREDGIFGRLHCYARLGLTQPDAVFAWGLEPNNCRSISRLGDGQIVVTHLFGLGANNIRSMAVDPNPGPLLLEGLESYSEVQNQALLDALIQEELNFRKVPRELVEIVPAPGRAPEPFTHFHLGDLVFVYCGPRLRGGFQGVQRIYGFQLSISEEGIETVSSIVTGPEN